MLMQPRRIYVFCLFIVLLAISLFGCGGSSGKQAAAHSPPPSDPDTKSLPIAQAGPIQSVVVGTRVQLDGRASSSQTSGALRYTWNIAARPPGSSATLSGATTSAPKFTADQPGSYLVQLLVTDVRGRISRRDFVTVSAGRTGVRSAADFDHTGILDNCVACHNGTSADGKPADHIATSDVCEACHSTNDFEPAIAVDHNEVLGSCSTCHDGVTARGKPPSHIPTDAECDTCHTPAGWTTGSGSGGGAIPDGDDDDLAPGSGVLDDDEEDDDDSSPGGGGAFDHSTAADQACLACHDGVIATGKPADHIPAGDNCNACHTTDSFEPLLSASHPAFSDVCTSCHNGADATGQPAGHIPTGSAECDTCHSIAGWSPLLGVPTAPPSTPGTPNPPPGSFVHIPISPGTACASCHNGIIATGKSLNHIPSSDVCDACHSMTSFRPAVQVDHTQVLGACTSCHDGITASGKPANHVPTTSECDVCHSTTTWLIGAAPAPVGVGSGFNHAGIGNASCVSCHNGAIASAKPATHIRTTNECQACHSTQLWSPALFVDHNEVAGRCSSCHNGVTATGKPANHVPTNRECSACHSRSSWRL